MSAVKVITMAVGAAAVFFAGAAAVTWAVLSVARQVLDDDEPP